MSQSPGQPPTQEEVEQIIREVDLDGDGTINFNEFITMMTGQPYPPPAPEDAPYATAWSKVDVSLSRPITEEQFKEVLSALGEESPSEEEVAGLAKDGKVTCELPMPQIAILISCGVYRADREDRQGVPGVCERTECGGRHCQLVPIDGRVQSHTARGDLEES
jgi:hypothetical protein